MKLSDIFFTLFYGAAFFLVVYFIVMLFRRNPIAPISEPTVVVVGETPDYYYEPTYWNWGAPYNWWGSWFPWGGGDGYYGRRYGPVRQTGWGRPHYGSGGRPYGGAGRATHGGFGGGRARFGGGGRRGGGGGGRR